MANSIMWLKNSKTGEKLAIAKWYPHTGWYCLDDVEKMLNEFFDKIDFPANPRNEFSVSSDYLNVIPEARDEWVVEITV